jgi:peptide/nickel transport system permease protein
MDSVKMMVGKRLAFGLLTVIVVSVLIFLGVEALPGDLAKAILGQQATPEAVAAFRRELKLDLPPHVRYFRWLGDFMRGDLGMSLANQRPIAQMIGWRLSNTLFLAVTAAMIAVPLSLVLGILAALYRNSWFDKTISISTLSAISFPEFSIAYILIAVFSVRFNLCPSMSTITDEMTFFQKIHNVLLPSLTLSLAVTAHMMRMTRAAIINVLSSEYIEMAGLKGIKRRRIIVHHALPNVLSPIINVIVLNLGWLIVGVVVTEVVFVYPGLGQLMVDSVSKRELPVIQACGLIFACTYILLNLLADVLSMVSNPRIR